MTVALALLGALALQGGSAQAATRTYVNAATGVDGLGCTLRVPCGTIQAAINATDPDGTVVITDSAAYPGVVVNKSLSLVATGAHRPEIRATTPVIADPGAAGDVTLKGITAVSAPYTRCVTDGCYEDSNPAIEGRSGALELDDVSARSPFGAAVSCGSGIALTSLDVTGSRLSGSDRGIACFGGPSVEITVIRSTFRRDGTGIVVTSCRGLTVDDSSFVHDWQDGLFIGCLGVVRHSRFAYSDTGIYVNGPGGGVYLGSSSLIRNGTAWSGNVVSFGDNTIVGNTHGDTPPQRVGYGR